MSVKIFNKEENKWVILPGTIGAPGKDAYIIAQENGYKGTKEEYGKILAGIPGIIDKIKELEQSIPTDYLTLQIVDNLPEEGKDNVLYITNTDDSLNISIWINGSFYNIDKIQTFTITDFKNVISPKLYKLPKGTTFNVIADSSVQNSPFDTYDSNGITGIGYIYQNTNPGEDNTSLGINWMLQNNSRKLYTGSTVALTINAVSVTWNNVQSNDVAIISDFKNTSWTEGRKSGDFVFIKSSAQGIPNGPTDSSKNDSYSGFAEIITLAEDGNKLIKFLLQSYSGSSDNDKLFLGSLVEASGEVVLEWKEIGGIKPDNEDLTTEIDSTGNSIIKLADRSYNPENFSGKGYKILRKNIVDGKNILTQDMINEANTVYEIRYDFDLNGTEITIPEGCTLKFTGGKFSNGTLNVNFTNIIGINCLDIKLIGSLYNNIAYTDWFILQTISPEEYEKDNFTCTEINNIIIQSLIDANYNIVFGNGIFPFLKPLYIDNATNICIKGKDSGYFKKTALYFPQSEGFWFGKNGSYSIFGIQLSNFAIDSLSHNIYLYKTDNNSGNFTSAIIDNLSMASKQGDNICAFNTPNSYNNFFKNCIFITDENHGFLNNLNRLQIIVDNCTDGWLNIYNITKQKTSPLYMFKNMGGIKMTNCNLSNKSLSYVVWCDGENSNLDASFFAFNCNFEAINGPIIYSPTNLYAWNIYFLNNNIVLANEYSSKWKGLFYCRLGKTVYCPIQTPSELECLFYTTDVSLLTYFNGYTSNIKSDLSEIKVIHPYWYRDPKAQEVIAPKYENLYADSLKIFNEIQSENAFGYLYKNDIGLYPNIFYTNDIPNSLPIGFLFYDRDKKELNYNRLSGGKDLFKFETFNIYSSHTGSTSNRPNTDNIYPMFAYYDTNLKKVLFNNNGTWITASGYQDTILNYGTFNQKPSNSDIKIGFAYFCTDKQTQEGASNGIMIYYKGDGVWVDALGRVVE